MDSRIDHAGRVGGGLAVAAQAITFERVFPRVVWPMQRQPNRQTCKLARHCIAWMNSIVGNYAFDNLLRQAAQAADRHGITIDEWLTLKVRALHAECEALEAESVELAGHVAVSPSLAESIARWEGIES